MSRQQLETLATSQSSRSGSKQSVKNFILSILLRLLQLAAGDEPKTDAAVERFLGPNRTAFEALGPLSKLGPASDDDDDDDDSDNDDDAAVDDEDDSNAPSHATSSAEPSCARLAAEDIATIWSPDGDDDDDDEDEDEDAAPRRAAQQAAARALFGLCGHHQGTVRDE